MGNAIFHGPETLGLIFVKFGTTADVTLHTKHTTCTGGITVRALDLRSSGRGFDSLSGRYQAT